MNIAKKVCKLKFCTNNAHSAINPFSRKIHIHDFSVTGTFFGKQNVYLKIKEINIYKKVRDKSFKLVAF